jgi:integrase
VERFHENERKVWLGEEQLQSFESALDSYSDQGAADALRLLVLTGARPHEVMGAEWNQFDLRRGTWTKPSHHTKQKEDSIIPVGDATMLILERMAKGRNGNSLPFLFPGRDGENARTTLRNAWAMVSRNAGLSVEYSVKGRRGKPLKRWKPKYRLYDLRHSYASHLVNRGQSLFLVGKLMGHTQAATTMKYAHAADSALRSVTNDFSKVIEMRPPKLA